jgi:hypothetical protein
MILYRKINGDTGVRAFSTGKDYIKVQFRDRSVYLYNYAVTGKEKVEQMKQLAVRGRGLTTFINRHVSDRYAAKLSEIRRR